MTTALFGHRDAPASIKPLLEQTLRRLTEENGDITFLVGTHGAFDLMAQSVLKKLSEEYPQMKYYIVLAYYAESNDTMYKGFPTSLPDGFETVPPRFAVPHRNSWIINTNFNSAYRQSLYADAEPLARLPKSKISAKLVLYYFYAASPLLRFAQKSVDVCLQIEIKIV